MIAITPENLTFEGELHRRLTDIEERAKAAGSNITRLCKKTGIARATYERWMYRAPQSITKVDELAAAVAELEAMTPAQRDEFNNRSAAAAASATPKPRATPAPTAAPKKKAATAKKPKARARG